MSRSFIPFVDDATRNYFSGNRSGGEGIGQIEGITSRLGPSYYGDPELLVKQLRHDVALQAADMVLITVPNQLGVAFNACLLEGVKAIGDELGWGTPPHPHLPSSELERCVVSCHHRVRVSGWCCADA